MGTENHAGRSPPFFEKGATQPAATPPATASESAENNTAEVVPAGKGPRVLPASARAVGRLVPDVEFRDLEGKSHRLSEYKDRAAVVVAMTSTTCPLSQKFLPQFGEAGTPACHVARAVRVRQQHPDGETC